jgi:hypothetical protein
MPVRQGRQDPPSCGVKFCKNLLLLRLSVALRRAIQAQRSPLLLRVREKPASPLRRASTLFPFSLTRLNLRDCSRVRGRGGHPARLDSLSSPRTPLRSTMHFRPPV